MKKIVAIAFLISFVAAPVFAADFTSTSNPAVPSGQPAAGDTISVLSKNVEMNVVSSATRFASATAHTSGSKQFGVTSEDTSIFSSAYENGVTALVGPTVSDSTSFSGWTSL